MQAREGWYEAPGRPGYLRYWDGECWTSGFAQLCGPSEGLGAPEHPLPNAQTHIEESGQRDQTPGSAAPHATSAPLATVPPASTESGTFVELARIFDWTGRTLRGPYWGLAGLNFFVWLAAGLTTYVSGAAILLVPAAIVSLAFVSATVRRLRDAGVSPAFALLMVVPLLWPVVFVLCSRPSLGERSGQPHVASEEPYVRAESAPTESRSRSAGELHLFCSTCVRYGGAIDVDSSLVTPGDNRWQFLLIRPVATVTAVACRDCLEVRELVGFFRKSVGRHLLLQAVLDCLEVAENALQAARAKNIEPNRHAEGVVDQLWKRHA